MTGGPISPGITGTAKRNESYVMTKKQFTVFVLRNMFIPFQIFWWTDEEVAPFGNWKNKASGHKKDVREFFLAFWVVVAIAFPIVMYAILIANVWSIFWKVALGLIVVTLPIFFKWMFSDE